MEQKLTVEINLERPFRGEADEERIQRLARFLEQEGYVEPGSVTVDGLNGRISLRATEKLLGYLESYLK